MSNKVEDTWQTWRTLFLHAKHFNLLYIVHFVHLDFPLNRQYFFYYVWDEVCLVDHFIESFIYGQIWTTWLRQPGFGLKCVRMFAAICIWILYLHDCLHCAAATWLAHWITEQTCSCGGVPNKLDDEFMEHKIGNLLCCEHWYILLYVCNEYLMCTAFVLTD